MVGVAAGYAPRRPDVAASPLVAEPTHRFPARELTLGGFVCSRWHRSGPRGGDGHRLLWTTAPVLQILAAGLAGLGIYALAGVLVAPIRDDLRGVIAVVRMAAGRPGPGSPARRLPGPEPRLPQKVTYLARSDVAHPGD